MRKIIDDLQSPRVQKRKTESYEHNITSIIDVGAEIKNLIANPVAVGGGPSRQLHSLHPPHPFTAKSPLIRWA